MMGRSVIARPWLKAGLSALLLESEERVFELQRKPEAARREPPVPSVSAERSGSKGGEVAASPCRAAPAVKKTSTVTCPAREPSGTDILVTPGAQPVESWPETWLALKNRRPLPPCPLVLWSYFGLGEDLTGVPDEKRRKVIVRMLMELRHPGGTHVFWPCNLPGEENGAALFWSGVKLLNPRVLLLFGSDTRDALSMPKTLFPFCEERVNGRLVIQLPRPSSLAEDEPSFSRALVFLSQRLKFCAKRGA
ncbi:hypothetical protein [Mailhella massiliensis]|uniref:Uracil-DNA glycosylase-like domain-containing protein n=1 Tax=Mailhella massiliensis TaxID=1903261 RepID=A0A921ATX3_9BACT|nr:hypothetical protein [Mailhella massiliensis]HJD96039.1 hypothetical protein [Mailhella massiliensis]